VNYFCMTVVTFIMSTFFHIYKLHNFIVKNYNTNLLSCFYKYKYIANKIQSNHKTIIKRHTHVCLSVAN